MEDGQEEDAALAVGIALPFGMAEDASGNPEVEWRPGAKVGAENQL